MFSTAREGALGKVWALRVQYHSMEKANSKQRLAEKSTLGARRQNSGCTNACPQKGRLKPSALNPGCLHAGQGWTDSLGAQLALQPSVLVLDSKRFSVRTLLLSRRIDSWNDSRVSGAVEVTVTTVGHSQGVTQHSSSVEDVSKACGVLTGPGSRTIDKRLLCREVSWCRSTPAVRKGTVTPVCSVLTLVTVLYTL